MKFRKLDDVTVPGKDNAIKPYPAIPKEALEAAKLAASGAPQGATAIKALPFIRFGEDRKGKRAKDIIKGCLGEAQTSSHFSEPKTGKSTLLVDLCCHIADVSKTHWRGLKIKKHCGVLYLAFERHLNVLDSIDAYKARESINGDLPFVVVGSIVDVIDQECVDIVSDTIKAVEKEYGIKVGLVIYDTWNKGIAAGGGDEDKAQYDNLANANLRRLIEKHPGLHCATVGHVGNQAKNRERGSSAKKGDRDVAWIYEKVGSLVAVKIAYSNCYEENKHVTAYKGQPVQIDTDEEGEPVYGWVAEAKVYPRPGQLWNVDKLGPKQELAFKSLAKTIQAHGAPWPAFDGALAVTEDQWLEQCIKDGAVRTEQKKARADIETRRQDLLAKGRIQFEEGWVTNVGELPPIPDRETTTTKQED
jgi:hypothetical protein